MKAWIQKLSKEQVISELSARNLPTEGTMDELRQRMRHFVDINPTSRSTSNATMVEETPRATELDTGEAFNQLRKWGLQFDGRDPLGFLEQVEELCDAAGFPQELLLKGLPIFLKGEALLWHRNNKEFFESWEQFRRELISHFLSPHFQAKLTREILGRQQKQNEPFKTFATELLTKMRRAGGFSTEDKLERLYENMSPEYKLYVRRRDVRSISELTTLAAEYEEIEQQKGDFRRPITPAVAAVYNRQDCCWRCKQRGHTRQNCKRPAIKFCSQCGKDGVLTKDCHPRPGNATQAGKDAATVRPAK